MRELKYKFKSYPFFSKYYTLLILFLSILMSIDYFIVKLNIYRFIYLDFNKTFLKLQVWRPITSVFYTGIPSIGLIFHLLLTNISIYRLELEFKSRKEIDIYAVMVVYIYLITVVFGFIFELQSISREFLMGFIFVECKIHSDEIKSIWGFNVKSKYVPYIFVLMQISLKGDIISDVVGIIVGYTYTYIKFDLKDKYSIDLLKTPQTM